MSTPGVINYPGSLDDADSLIRATNNALTTLAAPLGAADLSAQLASVAAFPESGVVSTEYGEIITYTGKSGATLTGLVRERESTTALANVGVGAAISLGPTARHHTVLADAIIATQTKLGVGASTPVPGAYLRGGATPGTSSWSALLQADVLAALGYTPQDAASAATDTELGVVAAAAAAAQATANTAVTNAATAQTTANTGVTNAATAQAAADSARAHLGTGADAPAASQFLKGTGAGTSAWSALTSGEVTTALGYTPATLTGATAGGLLVGTGAGAAAWQATSALTFTGGQLGINRAAPGAMLHAVASGAAVKGLIVQGAASQSGNLTEWQDNTGAVLSRINAGGQFLANAITVGATGSNVPALTISGYFVGSGAITITNLNLGSTQALIGGDNGLWAKSRGAAYVAGVFQGNASQTADLTQWQNSSGTVLSSIGPAGTLFLRPGSDAVPSGANTSIGVDVSNNVIIRSSGRVALATTVLQLSGSIQWFGGSGTLDAYNGAATTLTLTNSQSGGSASFKGIVKAGAGQGAVNLTEWQNSSATVLASVRADGLINATPASIATKQKAGTPTDGDWAVAPPDGTIVADSSASKLWMRVGGTWKSAALA